MNDAQAMTLAELSIGEYAPIRSAYKTEIGGAILEYLYTEGVAITRFRSAFKRAIADSFEFAFAQGYLDGGGDPEDREPSDQDWLAAKIDAEFGYVDMLFQQLKQFKADEETTPEDYDAEAERRAEGYAMTLDGVYSEGKIRGAKNMMLTFGGTDGQESCPDCQRLVGQRHRASWWVRRNLIPGQPGNASFECHGYNCRHILYNDKGEVFTV